MKERIIELFNQSGKDKIEFKPPIKIKMTPHSHTMWMDQMFKIKDHYMVTVSNQDDDKANKNINDLEDHYLSSLNIRMFTMYGAK